MPVHWWNVRLPGIILSMIREHAHPFRKLLETGVYMRFAGALAFLFLVSLTSFVAGQSDELPPPRLIRRIPSQIPPSSGPIRKIPETQQTMQVQHTESDRESAVPLEKYLQQPQPLRPAEEPQLIAPRTTAERDQWKKPVVAEPTRVWPGRPGMPQTDAVSPPAEDLWAPSRASSQADTSNRARLVVDNSDPVAPPPPFEDQVSQSRNPGDYNPSPVPEPVPPAVDADVPFHNPHACDAWMSIESMTEYGLPYFNQEYYAVQEAATPVYHEPFYDESAYCQECFSQDYSCTDCCDAFVEPGEFVPLLSIGLTGGNDRSITEVQAIFPLLQSETDLLFADLGGRFSDDEDSEGQFGLVYRELISPEWIFGMYGYFDHRRTVSRNQFNQFTGGFELISVDWDIRLNGYFPEGGSEPSRYASGFSNGTIVSNAFEERAYRGVNVELGRRILHWGRFDSNEFRWFVGYYYFDSSAAGFQEISGPRTRLEYRCYDLSWLGEQSRLTAGLEYSNDKVRDDQFWGFIRLQIPISPDKNRDKLDPLWRRFVDMTSRNIY